MALNLIIDGNYLFYKTLFIFGGYGSKGKVLESKKEQEMFVRKVATDFSHAVRVFGNPNKIVFTIDSKSWRKDIEIEDGAYKGHREEKSSSIDWDAFYGCMNEFAEILKSKNIIISREERAEGDDLMFLWANHFFNEGSDAVIITGDRDLTQCVKHNDKNFVVVYNPNSKSRKITSSLGFQSWLQSEEYNLFDANTYMNRSKDIISDALGSMPLEEIDHKYIIFEKVITGDAGDAVPPIWSWTKDNKTYRVTASKAKRMYDILNMSKNVDDVFDLPNRATEVAKAIETTCKHSAPSEVIKSRLVRNLQLVFLDERIIPSDIQEKFKISINQEYKDLGSRSYDMNSLLEGTRFVSNGKPIEADIFSQFNF